MRNALALAVALLSPLTYAAIGDRVQYDSHCFTIDGKDTLIYSGAFHYYRCPPELWPARFKAIKEAGFNTVETYVAWNDSEKTPPKDLDDFSHVDLKRLDAFLTMASKQFGLNVIIRPGPYICAEWDMGGYPAWLIPQKPDHPKTQPWLRGDDPTYLAWCRHWYRAVCPVIAKHQITRAKPGGKGVILFQIENEYDYAGGSDAVHLGQLHELAKDARENGIDVPLISCWTHQIRHTTDPLLTGVVDCVNFYPRWDVNGTQWAFDALGREQTTKPRMITELQGGWFSENGGLLAEDQSGITAKQERNLTLYCLQNGVTALSYYMLFGGTNLGDRTPPNITTSYDYFAPIREDGSVGPKYREVSAIGKFLEEYGAKIARSEPDGEDTKSDRPEVEVVVRKAQDGTRFVFLRNRNHESAFSGKVTVGSESLPYKLEPFDSYVVTVQPGAPLAKGEWLPKTPTTVVDTMRLATIPVADAWVRPDRGGKLWRPAVPGDVVRNGVLTNLDVVYRADLSDTAANDKLWLRASGGQATVRLNGQTITPTGKASGQPVFDLPAAKKASLEVVFQNPGRPNGGPGMEEERGLLGAKVSHLSSNDVLMPTWAFKPVKFSDAQSLVGENVDETGWESVTLHSGDRQDEMGHNGAVGVYRTSFSLTDADIQAGISHLDFGGIDDEGWIYINGQKVGESHQWDVPFETELPAGVLRAGKNTIAVIVRNIDGDGGLYEVPQLTAAIEGRPVEWQIGNLQGIEENWGESGKLGPEWNRVLLSAMVEAPRKIQANTNEPLPDDKPTDALANWYHLEFNLPPAHHTWGFRVNAVGNGFLWLNGHMLGRFWNQGPQREYFMPDNWLNPGKNVVVMYLTPVKGYAAFHAADIGVWGK
jgi:hypothetical protein